ncbi:hypothetical protein COCCADRAFT_108362 [Bipolaris zeicola 26-R-13]|uniref:Pentatricopeptide repeat protein n=1 Tax=Cochliobolus carbonum (strain 26-R-13) TaxID=930089 RepID=W6YC70_COCC2|nr:uncharacterized protein COCCADRAFT_108362 [Bipolaris zeicola 26-R-13]EUC28721.1 hypothetical protein COCCADRAFT_108362 [Bipolaris zeicola 26-R-13]
MLNCRACLWRCIQALDVPTTNAHRLRRNVNPLLVNSQQRLLSTRNVARQEDKTLAELGEAGGRSRNGEDHFKKSAFAAKQKRAEILALRQSHARRVDETPNLAKLGRRDPRMSESDWNRRKRELRHLQDPLDLAAFVKQELSKDRVEEMLQLVRMASHSMQCIVSWNHIIDHLLAKERVKDALKVYNDMKKRAQFPDSYTYTILLRGLSLNAHTSGVLSNALSVYHSLSAPNSRVEPSIIHTNAALKVCARAGDMDALWGVAGKIAESGPASANAITYITIINAIRQSLLINAPKGESEEETAARKERGIIEARRMWEDIIGRWRNADLVIDEELVCAMGRLLLVGSRPRDWDDVLSLVEQTMDIPRLVPRLGTADRRKAGFPHLRAPNVLPQYRVDDEHLSPDNIPARGDEFLPLKPKGALPHSLAFVRPGNNTLSIIQEACQKIVANKAAQEYWDLLTDPRTYKIVPDRNNLHMRLRNLRLNRASADAVQLLQEDMIGKNIAPRPGTFRIAMSTCVRDKNNHNSLKHAGRILNMMFKTLEDADPKTITMYAELATSFPLAKGSDLVNALTILDPIAKNIRLQLGVGGRERRYRRVAGPQYLEGEQRQDAITALRKIHGVYDKLLFSNLIAEEMKAPFKAERARLSAFIQRILFQDGHSRSKGNVEETTPSEEEDSRENLQGESDQGEFQEGEKEDSRPEWKKQWMGQIERPVRRKMRVSSATTDM